MVLPVLTGEVKAGEPVAPYSPSSDNHSTADTRTDKDLLAHLDNYRPGIITNGNGNEGDNTEARLKDSVIESKIPYHPASSSIASLFEGYLGGTTPSNEDIMPVNSTPGISSFSTSILFGTLSISTTYFNNNAIETDLTSILRLGNRRISIGRGGQLSSGLQIPMGASQDNSLNPISYFFTFTIRF